MSDRYVHLYPFTVRGTTDRTNLVTLGRYLIVNAGSRRRTRERDRCGDAGGAAAYDRDAPGVRDLVVVAPNRPGYGFRVTDIEIGRVVELLIAIEVAVVALEGPVGGKEE